MSRHCLSVSLVILSVVFVTIIINQLFLIFSFSQTVTLFEVLEKKCIGMKTCVIP